MVDLEVRGAINVVEACAQTESVEKIVFSSSLAAAIWRDDISSEKDVDEKSWSDPEFCRKLKVSASIFIFYFIYLILSFFFLSKLFSLGQLNALITHFMLNAQKSHFPNLSIITNLLCQLIIINFKDLSISLVFLDLIPPLF